MHHTIFFRALPRVAGATTLISSALAGQAASVPIRPVSAATATQAVPFRSISEVREVNGGKVLVNSGGEKKLVLFDATLSNPIALADTSGGGVPYPRFGKLIPYTGDSTLFAETDSRAFTLIDPAGKMGRVVAPPTDNFNGVTSGGPVGVDGRSGLITQTSRPFVRPPVCQTDGKSLPAQPAPSDSVAILRADFDKRTVDTLGKARVPVSGFTSPTPTFDSNCRAVSAIVRVNPAVPATDAWTVTSTGAIAIVRGHDYHVDWIDPDGTKRSGPKLPFDWRRLTDADKQARVDSARRVVDSLSKIGGYRLQSCDGGRSTAFNTMPPQNAPSNGRSGGSGVSNGGGGGGGSAVGVSSSGASGSLGGGDGPPSNPQCQNIAVTAEFVRLDEMADYIPPIRDNAARSDRDGNVWILPSTSASAKGGLLYDVVNQKGELVERVQLPPDRDIAGFGHGGVLYLSHLLGSGSVVLERVAVVRR